MSFRLPFFSKKSTASAQAPAQPSVEQLRQRARQRLIGASLLVLLAVLGFPIVFDSQPRAVPVNIPIEVPDPARTPPLVRSAANPTRPQPESAAVAAAPASTPVSTPVSAPVAAGKTSALPPASGLTEREEILPPGPEAKTPPHATTPPPSHTAGRADTAEKANPPAAAQPVAATPAASAVSPVAAASGSAATARYVVQVGAYADAARLREVRVRLERAGFKTYVQSVQTKDGARSRVRIGPFGSRAEADQVQAKLKALDLHAAVLTL